MNQAKISKHLERTRKHLKQTPQLPQTSYYREWLKHRSCHFLEIKHSYRQHQFLRYLSIKRYTYDIQTDGKWKSEKLISTNQFQPLSVCLTAISICFNRNAFSRKHSTIPHCGSSGMEISASLTAMIAATGGILPSMVGNAPLREPLMV